MSRLQYPEFHVYLVFEGKRIADIQFNLMKSTQRQDHVRGQRPKLEAVISEFQGKVDQETMQRFEEANGRRWSVALVQAVVDAAYEAKADRVLLRDITTTDSYQDLQIHKPNGTRERPTGEELDRRQNTMKAMYRYTANQCQINKKEGKYFVREFP